MDKVIKLLNSEKQHLPNQISHCINRKDLEDEKVPRRKQVNPKSGRGF